MLVPSLHLSLPQPFIPEFQKSNFSTPPSVSRETVQIGTVTTDEIIGTVAPICHESGQCETNPLEMKSQLFTSESVTNLIITISPDGEYPTWIRNGLLDALGAAAKTVAKCEDGTYTNTCPGVTAMAYCPRRKTQFTNCEVPKYWGINYQHPSVGNAAPPNLGFNINVVEEGKEDLCENVMTGLGAVAGKLPLFFRLMVW